MLKSIITGEAVFRSVLYFPTLVLSQESKGHNVISFPKRLFSPNRMSETGTILVNFKLAVRILCLVCRKYIAIPNCLIFVSLGLCVVLLWIINET